MASLPDAKLETYATAVWRALADYVGQVHAVSGRELCGLVGLPDERSLRLVVHYARERHLKPICSLAGVGYFRPANLDEVRHCYLQIKRTALQQLGVASVLKKLGDERLRGSDRWLEDLLARERPVRQEDLFTAV